jgi:hypothetical protein
MLSDRATKAAALRIAAQGVAGDYDYDYEHEHDYEHDCDRGGLGAGFSFVSTDRSLWGGSRPDAAAGICRWRFP